MSKEGVKVPFIGGSYEYRSRGVSPQRTINLYPEKVESGGKTDMVLVYTPGEVLVSTIGVDTDATIRGFWYSSTGPDSISVLYACYGDRVYRILRDFTYVEIGQVAIGTGPISICDNGFDLVVADGTALFRADLLAEDSLVADTWAQVDLPYLTGTEIPIRPSQVAFLQNRLIINSQRNEFYFSNLASTVFTDEFGVANFYSAESSADTISAMIALNGRLLLLGERSYEFWSSGGDSNNDPLSFINGSSSDIGILAPRSISALNDNFFWLGSSNAGRNTVYMVNGMNKPIRISTNAIEYELNSLSDTVGAVGWSYYEQGHLFYVLGFATARKTFVYDVNTNLWHERMTRDWNTGEDLAWEPQIAVTAYNDVYFGSLNGNRLLRLDPEKYTDYNDRPIVRKRISPIYYANYSPVTIRELYIDMEVGTTPLLATLGRDPQCMLRVSRDGGNTFVSYDWRSIGLQGEYTQSVKWSNLGSGRSFAIELTFSDPSPIVIYGARLAIQESSRR